MEPTSERPVSAGLPEARPADPNTTMEPLHVFRVDAPDVGPRPRDRARERQVKSRVKAAVERKGPITPPQKS